MANKLPLLSESESDHTEKCKLLHFEDDDFMADMYKRVLEAAGFEYVRFSCPPKASSDLVELVLKERPGLIIMDMVMPIVNGFEAINNLKSDKRTRFYPIFGLSNLDGVDNINRIKNLGIEDYFVAGKTLPSKLVDAIKRYLENPSAYISNL